MKLTRAEYLVLGCMGRTGGQQPATVASRTGLAYSTARRLCYELCDQGLLSRERSSLDGKVWTYYLTTHGADALRGAI